MGFFEIGVWHGKFPQNIGTLWRSAYQLGAAGLFTIGKRYDKQCTDTCKAFRHIPLRHYEDLEDFMAHRPFSAPLIAVEQGGIPLSHFQHPKTAVYLLGAEDHGLSPEIIERCQACLLYTSPSPRDRS